MRHKRLTPYPRRPSPAVAQCETYLGGAGPTGILAPSNHLPPPHKLTRTNREQIAENYKGISFNVVKGPIAYDTNKELDRGYGMRSDTDVVDYLRPPKIVVPAISAPQVLGGMSTTRSEHQWKHGGTFGANPIPTRTAMFGSSDNPRNRMVNQSHPWANQLDMAKGQLQSNPFAIPSFN